jgi:hypothetical protein
LRDGNQNLLGHDEGLRDTAAQAEIVGRHFYGGTEVPPFQGNRNVIWEVV